MKDNARILSARRVVTMNPSMPFATHVLVRDGHVLATGSWEEVSSWGDFPIDDTFGNSILLPGFVEGHSHMMAGGIWRYTYVGFHDREDPNGKHWRGIYNVKDLAIRLIESEKALTGADDPLVCWGFDPIFFNEKRLNRHDLDRVSSIRPIVVWHSNFHLMTVNSVALNMAGYGPGTDIEGVLLDDDGSPNGELQELAAMFPLMRRLKINLREFGNSAQSIEAYGRVARRCGVTTATDLFNDLLDEDIRQLNEATLCDEYPLRLVPALSGHSGTPDDIAQRAKEISATRNDKLRLGLVKLMTDGSIQGFTAQLKWPGYYRGPNHGIWNIAPEALFDLVGTLNREGLQVHVHVNGDAASELAIKAFAKALTHHPRPDHRHTLQHCQMADRSQFHQMAALRLGVNLFANHIFFFGDQHRDITMGPERASRMDACRTALDEGVNLSIHSDAPVTPMGPLTVAWCAANRLTGSGQVLGPMERITLDEAMRAITLGPARSLHLDHEIGSIESGKRADFAILDADPYEVGAAELNKINVIGTVVGGTAFTDL